MFQRIGDLEIYGIVLFYGFLLLFLSLYPAIKSAKHGKWSYNTFFLLLTFSVENFLCGFFHDDSFAIPIIIQICMSYGSAVIAFITFGVFIRNMVGMRNFKLFHPRVFFIVGLLSLSFLGVLYLFTESVDHARLAFIAPIILVSLVFSIDLFGKVLALYRVKEGTLVYYKRTQILLVIMSIICLAFVVFSTLLGDYQIFEQTAFTMCGLIIFAIYLLEEQKINNPTNTNEKLGILSDREKEVFDLVVEGYSYKEIASIISREYSTVSSTCSLIRKKLNVDNNEDLKKFI